MPTAIQFENVGKLYHLGVVGTGTLSHDLNRWWQTKVLRHEDPYLKIGETNDRSKRGSSDFVWALKDITFDVQQGDVVGIIGKNGAGKSTLLKLLSRVTTPTVGAIRARGRIASLLEVGTGFHPEMTGRENIYMNGSIMGMRRHEITSKLDEIVDFAGVARYLDTPVKRYSSGMMVRLGFAVAAFLEPEILVVDEVLAVGDAEFQKKAIGKMQDVSSGEGRTVLFVSHNMAAVQALCKKGVILEHGQVAYTGDIDSTIDRYLCSEIENVKKISDSISFLKPGVTIHSIKVNGSESNKQTVQSNSKYIDVEIKGNCTVDTHLNLIFKIMNNHAVPMAKFYPNEAEGKSVMYKAGDFTVHERIALPEIIGEGMYKCSVHLGHHPLEFSMLAPESLELTFLGQTKPYGQIMQCKQSGFCGLDRYED